MTTVAGKMHEWLSAGLGLVYPEVCQLCHGGRAALGEGLVCDRCRSEIRFIRPPRCESCGLPFAGALTTRFECSNCRDMELHFSSARSAVVARTTVLEAIHQYKYSHAPWFEPFLAGLLVQEAVPALQEQDWHLIVPVPLHPLKFREREFNQAARLARRLGAATGIAVEENILRRVTPTRTQTMLSRAERAKNMHGAFAVRAGTRLTGRKIVVVDDVFTTGATTSACARALRAAGAAEVCVWTVARGL